MSSSKSSPKRAVKVSFKPVSPFDLFYQLTYMSAMAAAGLSRSKTFEIAAQSSSSAAAYFAAVNTLVDEFRYDYPEACRRVGEKTPEENMRTFLLRLSDALRSGEPLPEFLTREAEIQGEDYQNDYERSLEAMKQWENAFSSIVISVALIVIIQVVTSMIYSTDVSVMLGLVGTGVVMSGFGAWIIWRSAPAERMVDNAAQGSAAQRRAVQLGRLLVPLAALLAMLLAVLGVPTGWVLIAAAVPLLPIGVVSMRSDGKTIRKDKEFSTFLRSTGGMATASGTTLKEALGKIDLSSFPVLREDIERLAKRLQARISPDICWEQFGRESGSRLIGEVTGIFYGAIKIGGDPERVGYVCSLFASRTTQLRAKRRLANGTFAGLTTVMQAVIAGLMVFVISIVLNFAELVQDLMPSEDAIEGGQSAQMNISLANFTPSELEFLSTITLVMIILMAFVTATAIILGDGGFKHKLAFYLALTILISGISYIVVPPLVAGILTI